MSTNILHVLEAVGKEKGIDREILIDALERALVTATKSDRKYTGDERVEARVDRHTGKIDVFSIKEVVKVVTDPNLQIPYAQARDIYPDVMIGEEIEIPHEYMDLGRIGAQKAKQVITQIVRDAERQIVMDQYGSKVHEIINGIVSRVDRHKYFVNIGRVEGHLPFTEVIPGENYKRGDRIRVIIQEVRDLPSGPVVMLSRTSEEFMRKLFEQEVPEINDGTITIIKIVRDPGVRAKMSVVSKDGNVDPVGACVGVKGSRVQSIVRELRNENIDIIPYSENIVEYVNHALSPARVRKVKVNPSEKSLEVLVDDDQQLSLAIGRRGQNVRLAHRLLGWKIDIYSPAKLAELGLNIFNEVVDSPFKEGDGFIGESPTEEVLNPFKSGGNRRQREARPSEVESEE